MIGVLQFSVWGGPGFDRLATAIDSEYVVNGITSWIKNWLQNGWVKSNKKPVENRDLWEMLLEEVRRHAIKYSGLQVMFWHIPRELNKEADEASKKGAKKAIVPDFIKYKGIMIKPTEIAVI